MVGTSSIALIHGSLLPVSINKVSDVGDEYLCSEADATFTLLRQASYHVRCPGACSHIVGLAIVHIAGSHFRGSNSLGFPNHGIGPLEWGMPKRFHFMRTQSKVGLVH